MTWQFDANNIVLQLGQCTNCGMVYVTNSDQVDMSNRKYVTWKPESDEDTQTHPAMIGHNKAILKLVSKYIPNNARILDYGAGYCGFLRVAKSAGYNVEGINPCIYMADWAMRKFNIKVHATFGQYFEPPHLFNLVVSDQTFEHLEEPKNDLRKIHQLLADDGVAYINVPNYQTYQRYLHGTDCLKDVSHYNYFTPGTLEKLCTNEGFRIIEVAPTLPYGGIKEMAKRVLDRLGIGDCSILLQKA